MRERRRFIRLNSAVSVNYKRINSQEEAKEIFSKNVSEGGICITVNEELKESDLLDLTISIPGHKTIISVVGRVIWVKEIPVEGEPEKKVVRAGLAFTGISKEAMKEIEEYITGALFDTL